MFHTEIWETEASCSTLWTMTLPQQPQTLKLREHLAYPEQPWKQGRWDSGKVGCREGLSIAP